MKTMYYNLFIFYILQTVAMPKVIFKMKWLYLGKWESLIQVTMRNQFVSSSLILHTDLSGSNIWYRRQS